MNDKIKLYHRFLKFKGIYRIAWKSLLRLVIAAAIIIGILVVAQLFISDLSTRINDFFEKWNPVTTLIVFFVSETILGLIPPDFFIAWSETTANPCLTLSLLAVLSCGGGIAAFYIGRWLRSFPRINRWVEKRFSSHFYEIKKYGAFIIVFSALLPLPFSTISLIAGIVNYPDKPFLLWGSTRLLRFYGYAIFWWYLIKFFM